MIPLHRLIGVVSLLVLAPLCHAVPVLYTATLSGGAEIPVVASPGTGSVSVTYDSAAHTLQLTANFTGLLGATTAAHIHAPTSAGVNAGVATQTPSFTGFPLGVTSGTYSSPTFDLTLASSWNAAYVTANGGTTAGAETAFAASLNNGFAYFNVHTSQFPGGEIRGVLSAANPTPDNGASVFLAVPVLLGLFGAARRRQAA